MSNVAEVNAKVAKKLMKNGYVLVSFWAPWWRPCEAVLGQLEEVASRGGVVVVRVNADKEPDFMDEMKVASIPTTFAYAYGELIGTVTGLDSMDALVEKLNDSMGKTKAFEGDKDDRDMRVLTPVLIMDEIAQYSDEWMEEGDWWFGLEEPFENARNGFDVHLYREEEGMPITATVYPINREKGEEYPSTDYEEVIFSFEIHVKTITVKQVSDEKEEEAKPDEPVADETGPEDSLSQAEKIQAMFARNISELRELGSAFAATGNTNVAKAIFDIAESVEDKARFVAHTKVNQG
jgi:thiol-disulfide isomerase/thioredoxin